MQIRLLLALLIIAALMLAIRWFKRTAPEKVSRVLKNIALWGGIAILVLLAVTGRLHWLFAVLASLIPVARRLLPWLRYAPLLNHWRRRYKAQQRTGGASAPNQTSQVETNLIRMTLDHASGEIDGQVLRGAFAGKTLSAMSLSQLLTLHKECQQQDEESTRLLQAFLDYAHGEQWRENSHIEEPSAAASSVMTRHEAFEILGLAAEATEADIITAHRRLMQKLHPDRGGSTYLAAKINQAKDLLLNGS